MHCDRANTQISKQATMCGEKVTFCGHKKGRPGQFTMNRHHPASLLPSALISLLQFDFTAKPPVCTCNNYIIEEIGVSIKQIFAYISFCLLNSLAGQTSTELFLQRCTLSPAVHRSCENPSDETAGDTIKPW